MIWRRLLKFFVIAVISVAVLGLIGVWGVLGVNPFEGKADHLWLHTSNEVDFFVRFPPLGVIEDEPLFGKLEDAGEPYDHITQLRADLAQAAVDIARDINPQIPMGLVEIDLKKDFLNKEMAIGGTCKRDFGRPRFDSFVFLARVPFYARFLSALKRGFIRNKIKDANIELVNGLYFEVRMTPAFANRLRPYRTPIGRPGGDTTFYVARIKDVVVFSDNSIWIEHALQSGVATLQADAWFLSEFIHRYKGGNRIEAFVRPTFTTQMMFQHVRRDASGGLRLLRELFPPTSIGELTTTIEPRGDSIIEAQFNSALASDGFDKMAPYMQAIYDSEKGDPKFDLSENGLARFIPRENSVGGIILHAKAEPVFDMVMNLLTPEDRQNLDDEVTRVSRERGRNYTSFRNLVAELTSELGDDHLVVLHRPTVFKGKTYQEVEEFPPVPNGQLSFTLVSSVKESARPDKIREKLFTHLQWIGMNAKGVHPSGKFHLAEMIIQTGDTELIQPAYGALSGGKRFIVFSTSVEGAAAVYNAAEDMNERMITTAEIGGAIARLPSAATATFLLHVPTLQAHSFDSVREVALQAIQMIPAMTEYRNSAEGLKTKAEMEKRNEDFDDHVLAWWETYLRDRYPFERDKYKQTLAFLDPAEYLVGYVALGLGPDKKVKAGAVLQLSSDIE